MRSVRSGILLTTLAASGCTLLFDPGPTRDARRVDAGSEDARSEDSSVVDTHREDAPGLDPCASRCVPGRGAYCEPRPGRTVRSVPDGQLRAVLGTTRAGLAVTGVSSARDLSLQLVAGDVLRDHALADVDGGYTAVVATAARGALRLPLGTTASEISVAGDGTAIATSLGSVAWVSARGAGSLFGDDTDGAAATSLCSRFSGCAWTPRSGPTVGALAGGTAFVAIRGTSSWSFVAPGAAELSAEPGHHLRGTAGDVVVEESAPGLGVRLFVGDGAAVAPVDLAPCARAAVGEDRTVVIAHAPACTTALTEVRIQETTCTRTGCACGATCAAGEIEAEIELASLALPSEGLVDWEFEVAGDVRVLAMLVGDTSASSTGTDVLVAAWNAADGASAPRQIVPVLVSSGRLTTVRGMGRDLELVVRRTATTLDVVVAVAVRAGEIDALAVGGLTLCGG